MISLLYRLADAARNHRRVRGSTAEQANGRRGEDMAHRFLRRQGLIIVARNYRPLSGSGEVDIIAWEGETLVFVEVKARTSTEYGSPDRAVGLEKEKSLRRTAADYIRRCGASWEQARLDLIKVVLSEPPEIEWVKDAFGMSRKI